MSARSISPILIVALGFACVSPGPKQSTESPRPSAPTPRPEGAADAEGPMWLGAGQVLEACDAVVRRAQARLEALVEGPRLTSEEALKPYDRTLLEIDRVKTRSELIAAVHPAHTVRGAAEVCTQALSKFESEIATDRGIYEVMRAADTDAMSAGAKRFVAKVLEDFRRAGVDKDAETRARLRELDAQMVRLGQDFARRIREGRGWIAVPPKALDGLPEDFIERHPPDWQGLVELTTDYTDFFPVVTYAHDEAVRRDLYLAFLNRAHPSNDEVLGQLLAARDEYADRLGFDSWTDYMADDKMIGSAEAIDAFIERVSDAARPRAEAELEILLERKRRDDPNATAIEVWDRFYYVQRLRDERLGFDAKEARKYFAYEDVLQGTLTLFGEMFGLRFEPEHQLRTWHHSVRVYNAYDGDWLVGRFYLDMHPRPDKYEHAAMFPMGVDRSAGHLPSAALVANFPDPKRTEGPALLDHAEVRTLFHEMGHIVHYLLASATPWANQAGTSVELDFVEAPAQMFEEWAWKTEVLQRFARHVETGAPIPAELVERMRVAHELGKGVRLMRQVYLTALSAKLHQAAPPTRALARFQEEMMKKYSPYAYPAGTHGYASFGHLEVYSSMYYVYQWSLSLAKDMSTRFEQAGVTPRLAQEYARAVLRPGGSRDAVELTADFLGRAPNHEAYLSWISSPDPSLQHARNTPER